jgi:hypothetical protein
VAKVWVLDTETKGTGANMVPLERVQSNGSGAVPHFKLPELKTPAPGPAEPRAPRRFKVVDVVTREVLAGNADARSTIGVLQDIRSIVDVTIYVWQPERERWRMLSLDDARTLWEYRGRLAASDPDQGTGCRPSTKARDVY